MKFVKIQRGAAKKDAARDAVKNLLSHLPGEATGLYIAGLDALGKNATTAPLVIVAVVSLGVLVLVRYLARASISVTIASMITFVIWVYALGNGPFQSLGLPLVQGIGAFLVISYSTILTILASSGVIK